MIRKIYQKIFSEKQRMYFHIVLRKFSALFLIGNNYYCPCCNKSFSKFLGKGNTIEFRKNAVCPNCGSLERTRLLYLYLMNETDIFNKDFNILHIAPEYILKKKLIHNPNYIDADINPLLASKQIDITEIQFPDNKFDFIICSHVLGHIPNESKAISELYRVLKPLGSLLLLSLINEKNNRTIEDTERIITEEDRLKFYGEKDLMRLYGADFTEKISRPGVIVERIDYRRNFSKYEGVHMSLGDGRREIIFKIIKK